MKKVVIEKWFSSDNKKYWYWIVDIETTEGIDGFNKKWQAIEAIKRLGFIRINKTVKENK